jgi:hypothetical protein
MRMMKSARQIRVFRRVPAINFRAVLAENEQTVLAVYLVAGECIGHNLISDLLP